MGVPSRFEVKTSPSILTTISRLVAPPPPVTTGTTEGIIAAIFGCTAAHRRRIQRLQLGRAQTANHSLDARSCESLAVSFALSKAATQARVSA